MKGKRIVILFAALVLGILAFAVISMPMRAQNQLGFPYGPYPTQFAASRTSRPRPDSGPRSPAKFNRVARPIPNEYIVVLNDDTPSASVTATINALAEAHAAVTKHNFGTS